MIDDIRWSSLFESGGAITGSTSYDINDVCWSKLFEQTKKSTEEYGVEWDYSNPSPVLTRTGDAAGFSDPVPATSLAGTGSSPFDNIMPWAGMKMCNIIDGEVVYWQGDPQFSETDYDTMVYIPVFWYKAEKNADTSKWTWSISPTEREGYVRHPGSERYIGKFHTSGNGAGVFSASGKTPLVNTSRVDFRTYSHNKGAKWWQLDLATWSAVQLLYLVEFANFNSQDKLGTGQDSGSVKASGGTSGAAYHTMKRSNDSNQYRWMEDLYSNIYDWIDGVCVQNRKVYAGSENSKFSENINDLAYTKINLPASGTVIGFGYSQICPYAFMPDQSGAFNTYGLTTYVADAVTSPTGSYAMCVGGVSSASERYGLFYVRADYTGNSGLASRGARLIFIP